MPARHAKPRLLGVANARHSPRPESPSLSTQYLADDLVHQPLNVSHGHASVPTGPGLGVTVDLNKVDRYRCAV